VAGFLAAHPEITAVDAILVDLSGVVRGKRYPIADLGKIYRDGMAMPGSVFLLDTAGESHDPGGRGFSDGDPDKQVKVIPGSLKLVPWASPPLAQMLLTFREVDGAPYAFEPRNVLARTLERVRELGLNPVIAFELEFYLVDREHGPGGAPRPPISPLTGERDRATQVYGMNEVDAFTRFLEDVVAACAVQDIPTAAVSAEYAPGQFEINLKHINDPLLAADHCVLFKRVVKGIARRHGYQATFMAKPYVRNAGSGMHLHISLWDKRGRNVFDGGERASEPLLHAVGGILDILPESMAILAPNVNSYRRFLPNIFVPIRRSWGYENRSVALRLPLARGAAWRIEHRIAGADANPYLVLATALAGVHHGLTNRIDPGPAAEGNAGTAPDPELPLRPHRALERFLGGSVLPSYIGEEYVRVYHACKLNELQRVESHISPVEYEWYLQAE
jgi:glutamine synthetase